MLLTQLHFKPPTGAHLLLMEYQLCQLCFQQAQSRKIMGSGVSKRGSNVGIFVQLSQQLCYRKIHIVDAGGPPFSASWGA